MEQGPLRKSSSKERRTPFELKCIFSLLEGCMHMMISSSERLQQSYLALFTNQDVFLFNLATDGMLFSLSHLPPLHDSLLSTLRLARACAQASLLRGKGSGGGGWGSIGRRRSSPWACPKRHRLRRVFDVFALWSLPTAHYRSHARFARAPWRMQEAMNGRPKCTKPCFWSITVSDSTSLLLLCHM